jgi:DnaJ-class molecular chaperone
MEMPSGPAAQAFKMLGLSASATPAEISAAYRQLAQMYHPDKVAGLAPEFQVLAEKRMKEINAAYELLKERGNPTQQV